MRRRSQFTQAYDQVHLDFDLTCYDLVTLLNLAVRDTMQPPLQHPMTQTSPMESPSPLEKLLGGELVLLTTHSYVILKELDLQATPEDNVRFFSLHGTKAGTRVTVSDELASLDPNPILQQYGSLYDRDIHRAAGRKQR